MYKQNELCQKGSVLQLCNLGTLHSAGNMRQSRRINGACLALYPKLLMMIHESKLG